MKKTILQILKTRPLAAFVLLLYFSISIYDANAQLSTSTYLFSQTTSGTYSSITGMTGDTTIGSTSSDDEIFLDRSSASALTSGTTSSTPTGTGFDIGFNFEYVPRGPVVNW